MCVMIQRIVTRSPVLTRPPLPSSSREAALAIARERSHSALHPVEDLFDGMAVERIEIVVGTIVGEVAERDLLA